MSPGGVEHLALEDVGLARELGAVVAQIARPAMGIDEPQPIDVVVHLGDGGRERRGPGLQLLAPPLLRGLPLLDGGSHRLHLAAERRVEIGIVHVS